MHLITGYSGTPHITSANDGEVNAHIFGTGSYVFDSRTRFSADIISNNVININAGEGLLNGRYFEIVTGGHDVANIDNGSAGVNRIDLIVARYTKDNESGIEDMFIHVIKGTPSATPEAPAYESGNILDGVGIADFPLYKVNIEGITIKSVESLYAIRKDIVADVKEANAITKADILADNANTLAKIKADNASHYNGIMDGTIKVPKAETSDKLGTSNVGGTGKPIYLNKGIPTACTVNNTPTTNSTALVTSGGVAAATKITQVFGQISSGNVAAGAKKDVSVNLCKQETIITGLLGAGILGDGTSLIVTGAFIREIEGRWRLTVTFYNPSNSTASDSATYGWTYMGALVS